MNKLVDGKQPTLLRFLIGTIAVSVVGPYLAWQIQSHELELQEVKLEKELELKELEQLDKHADKMFDLNLADRKDRVEFYAAVSQSKRVSERWRGYLTILNKKEKVEKEDKQRIEQEIKQDVSNKEEKLLEEQKKIISLKKKLPDVTQDKKADLEQEIEKQKQDIYELVAQRTQDEINLSIQQAKLKDIESELTVSRKQPVISKTVRIGWVYLGEHDQAGTSSRWVASYVDLPSDNAPSDLVNTKLSVTAASLNVRAGMPGVFGSFKKVTDVLNQSDVVEILEVVRWQNTDYVWARVKY